MAADGAGAGTGADAGTGTATFGRRRTRTRAKRRPAGAWVGPLIAAPAALVLFALAWAALAPLTPASRDEVFEIPPGTWARRMAGDQVGILPQTVHLTLGANDVLVLRNLDAVPQAFGPVLIMPGQTFRLPFELASTYSFACSAHASGQLSVVVAPAPVRGWPLLRWRARHWFGRAAPGAAG